MIDSNLSPEWRKYRNNSTEILSTNFLVINRIKQTDLGRYECFTSDDNSSSSLTFDLKRSELFARRFPSKLTSLIRIEFQSSINQLKLGGTILLNCSSSDKTSVRWLIDQPSDGLTINQSSLSFSKFSPNHFNYYRCANEQTQKTLVLSPIIFDLVKQMNTVKKSLPKYNKSFIEILSGKYVGDNVTLICRIGQGNRHFSNEICACLFD